MTNFFSADQHLPRPLPGPAWEPLRNLHGRKPHEIEKNEFNLREATFHTPDRRVSDKQLTDWREDLNRWAYDRGFPANLDDAKRSDWDVAIGVRLLADTKHMPEGLNGDVWCWITTHLLPHLVVYRWGWPAAVDREAPIGQAKWDRFGPTLKNGLRLAVHRIVTYGEDIARRATENEFQSIQYRPAYGLDQRVARLILGTLVEASEDPSSNYGKGNGNRTLDSNLLTKELRVLNSMRPLCFASDSAVVNTVRSVIDRLPDLRPPND